MEEERKRTGCKEEWLQGLLFHFHEWEMNGDDVGSWHP